MVPWENYGAVSGVCLSIKLNCLTEPYQALIYFTVRSRSCTALVRLSILIDLY